MSSNIAVLGGTGKIGRRVARMAERWANDPGEYDFNIGEIDIIGRNGQKVDATGHELNAHTELFEDVLAYAVGKPQFSSSIFPHTSLTESGNEYDFIVVAAAGRKPPSQGGTTSRVSSMPINVQIMADVVNQVNEYREQHPGKDPHLVVVTNPVDAITWLIQDKTGLPASHVSGIGGIVDENRMRYIAVEELGLSQRDRQRVNHAIVIGEHGKQMVPLADQMQIDGIGIADWVHEHAPEKSGEISEIIERIVKATREEGARINNAQGRMGASELPAAAIVRTMFAVLTANKHGREIRASAWDQENGAYVGQPVTVDPEGINARSREEWPPLTSAQEETYQKAVAAIKQTKQQMDLQWELQKYPVTITEFEENGRSSWIFEFTGQDFEGQDIDLDAVRTELMENLCAIEGGNVEVVTAENNRMVILGMNENLAGYMADIASFLSGSTPQERTTYGSQPEEHTKLTGNGAAAIRYASGVEIDEMRQRA